MSQKLFQICNIIAEGEEDYKTLLEYLGSYPISISRTFPDEMYFEVPTLVVGWNCVKNKFPNQNITNKQVDKNLFWSFSKAEDSKNFFNQAEVFFVESVKKWMPTDFKIYDSYLNKESLDIFIGENIYVDKKVFVYFYEGALYINNDGNNFIINIKSLFLSDKNFKKTITDMFNYLDIVSFSYHNFYSYVNIENLKQITAIDSLRWVKYGVETLDSYFNIIPNFRIQKYIPFLMSKVNPITLDFYEEEFYKRMCKRDEITCWLSSREIAFLPTFENTKLDFKIRKNCKLAKINFSNKRTITGRIASKDSYNPQNLDKKNDERKDIISRFEDGNILVFDYVSFETKISLYLSGDKDYIEEYHNEDLHYETAMMLYDTGDVTLEQRDFSKILNHSLLYGAGEDTLLKKLSTEFKNPEEQLYKVRQLLSPIIKKSDEIKEYYKVNGFLVNPWGSIIHADKIHASFNNYIQSYASEIVVDKLFEIKDFLKQYRTEFLFQVHDSLVFDLHPEESFLIEKIATLLEQHKNMLFGLSYSIGPNYKELRQVIGTK
jgi:hypothetical protein